MKKLSTTLLAAATALTLTACGQDDSAFTDEELDAAREVGELFSDTTTSTPSTFVDTYAMDQPGTFRDGTHVVGTDIEPGTYSTEGTNYCYWERLSGFGGTSDDIVANANPRGPVVVTVEPSDAGFMSQNCGKWTLVE